MLGPIVNRKAKHILTGIMARWVKVIFTTHNFAHVEINYNISIDAILQINKEGDGFPSIFLCNEPFFMLRKSAKKECRT